MQKFQPARNFGNSQNSNLGSNISCNWPLDNEMTFKFYRHASAYIKETLPLHSKNLFQLHVELPGKLQVKSAILRNFQIFVKPVNFWNLSNIKNYKTFLERIWKKGY